MGLPNLDVIFKTQGATAIQRSQKGTMAILLRDTKHVGTHVISSITDIPKGLGAANKEYVQKGFIGYQETPKKILLYVLGAEEDLEDGLNYFSTQHLDYLVGMPDLIPEEAEKISIWTKTERQNNHTVKSILPHQASDHEGIINFTGEELTVITGTGDNAKTEVYDTGEYCSRIAGMILGTPMKMSSTFAPLPEVSDIKRYTEEELDNKISRGELVLYHDGEDVLIGRGVNSFVTTTQDKGHPFQKIKIVEVVDMINNDLRKTIRKHYIGKYANSYDNKCLLISAIQAYFEELERIDILARGTSETAINFEKQRIYLKGKGEPVEEMSEQEIKEANTDSNVFIKARVSILDAIEDVEIEIAM